MKNTSKKNENSSLKAVKPSSKECDHCHEEIISETRLELKGQTKLFCCHGCKSVFQILNETGLGTDYYRLKDDSRNQGRPEYSTEAYEYLDEGEFKKKYLIIEKSSFEFSFFVEGVHCVACLWLLEQLPKLCDGVLFSKLNMATSVLKVQLKEGARLSSVAQKLSSLGYRPHPLLCDSDQEAFAKKEDRKSLIRIGVAFACAGNIMLYSFANYFGAEGIFKIYFNAFTFICSVPVMTYCALPFYKTAWHSLKSRKLSIDIPIVVALAIGMGMGVYSFLLGKDYFYFDTLTTLIFLLLLARYILKKAQAQSLSSRGLSNFFIGKSAIRFKDGCKQEVLSKFLEVRDTVIVKAGEIIPIDGKIIKGTSYINNSLLTGEVFPELARKSDPVFMGAKNLGEELFIEVSEKLENTRLAKMLSEIEMERGDSKITALSDVIAQRFIFFIFILSILFFFYFSFYFSVEVAFSRTLALLIITCPCALALTTPLALILGLSSMAKEGVFIKSEQTIERLSGAEKIFFDKTGTITYGEFSIVRISETKKDEKYFHILYSLELNSHHPIARSIVEYVESENLDSKVTMLDIKEIPGVGVEGSYEEKNYIVKGLKGKRDFETKGALSRVGLFENGELVLSFDLSDKLRKGVEKNINEFVKYGLEPYILSGDNKESVLGIVSELPIKEENILYEKSPEEKKEVISQFAKSIMVGDGINDAIALKSSYVGIAVKGSAEISLRAADVYLSQTGVTHILNLIKASRSILRLIYRNLLFSFIYNIIGIYLAFTGQVSPLVAAILMPLSSLTVLFSTFVSTKSLKKIIS